MVLSPPLIHILQLLAPLQDSLAYWRKKIGSSVPSWLPRAASEALHWPVSTRRWRYQAPEKELLCTCLWSSSSSYLQSMYWMILWDRRWKHNLISISKKYFSKINIWKRKKEELLPPRSRDHHTHVRYEYFTGKPNFTVSWNRFFFLNPHFWAVYSGWNTISHYPHTTKQITDHTSHGIQNNPTIIKK